MRVAVGDRVDATDALRENEELEVSEIERSALLLTDAVREKADDADALCVALLLRLARALEDVDRLGDVDVLGDADGESSPDGDAPRISDVDGRGDVDTDREIDDDEDIDGEGVVVCVGDADRLGDGDERGDRDVDTLRELITETLRVAIDADAHSLATADGERDDDKDVAADLDALGQRVIDGDDDDDAGGVFVEVAAREPVSRYVEAAVFDGPMTLCVAAAVTSAFVPDTDAEAKRDADALPVKLSVTELE